MPGPTRDLGFARDVQEGANAVWKMRAKGACVLPPDDKLTSRSDPGSEGVARWFEGFARLTELRYPAGITGLSGA